MTPLSRRHRRWLVVVLFAIAMAWVEAACVYYLRVLVDRVDPFQANPLPLRGVLGQVELVREAATLVMLATLGSLAGRTATARLGYAAVAFGTWDIFYYVFLRLIGGWPRSVFDWDILFLIPLPWWGPVLAPVLIASLMVVGGTWATHPRWSRSPRPRPRARRGVCTASASRWRSTSSWRMRFAPCLEDWTSGRSCPRCSTGRCSGSPSRASRRRWRRSRGAGGD